MCAKLLSRDDFREGTFRRDKHVCVLCGAPGKDAHHIVDRRLWGNGGYFLENGATVCEPCHLKCERTLVSCEELRERCGIKEIVLPERLYLYQIYDKWANPILPNGTRLRGELFFDESVQKVLSEGGVLHLFTNRVKYPRTFHLPWSPGTTEDDKVLTSLSGFEGEEVVVSLKLDGENTSLQRDYIHARSLEYAPRIDRDRIKALHASIAFEIPEDWRICGENLWAEHSISYKSLNSLFYVFSIWNEKNVCLSWEDTLEWAQLLGLPTVPVLYRGPWDEKLVRKLHQDVGEDGEEREGYVVRVARSFSYGEFRRIVGKYVRASHVRTQAHWTRIIKPNPFVENL